MSPLPRVSTHRAVIAAVAVMSMASCTAGSTSPGGSDPEQADGAAGGVSDGAASGNPGTSVGEDSGGPGSSGGTTGVPGDAGGNGDGGNAPSSAGTDAGRDSATGSSSGDAGPVCVTSAAKGSCGPYLDTAITGSNGSNTTVGQDVWNPISGWSQTLYATDPGSWYVTANLPAANTAVVSFPNTGESYDENPLTGFSSITSSFAETMSPTSGTRAEAAYDIWLNDWNNEVMIQHDMVNRGGPCGPVLATTSFGGSGGVPVQSWILCQYGSELIWQVSGSGDTYGVHSGSVDVLAMLDWLVSHGGYLPTGSTLTAIGYGFEICSTGGTDESFAVSSFSIASAP